MKKLTTEEFIQKAKSVHGDMLDYSKTKYVNRRTKVYIECPIHGGFWQFPERHLKSFYGCPMCGHGARGVASRLTYDDFVANSRKIHGDRYSYKKAIYIGYWGKVEIICKKHGSFMQAPAAHMCGQGCPKCGLESISKKKLMLQKEIIEKFVNVHGDYYDYSNVVYRGYQKKVDIICPIHGVFSQTPAIHIGGCGCPKCGNKKKGEKSKQTKEEFEKKARLVHGTKYDYSQIPEGSLSTEIVPIICPEHGLFMQIKNNHLKGSGCPHCPNKCISLGEKKVSEVLKMLNIKYIPQYKVENRRKDIKNNFFLIDFYLPKNKIFIEYNGSQHYESALFFGGISRFKQQKERDFALRQYCKENEIKLIEIPYWDFDRIEEILRKELV